MYELLFVILFLIVQCGTDKALEQRMWVVWTGLELRMRLGGDKPWMVWQLTHLDNTSVRRLSGKQHASLDQSITIEVVDLITVTMSLMNRLGSI